MFYVGDVGVMVKLSVGTDPRLQNVGSVKVLSSHDGHIRPVESFSVVSGELQFIVPTESLTGDGTIQFEIVSKDGGRILTRQMDVIKRYNPFDIHGPIGDFPIIQDEEDDDWILLN